MKRERKKDYTCDGNKVDISKVWPIFFWELCVICKKEFRREYGWHHFTHNYRGISRHVCCECCKTEEDAVKAVSKYVKDFNERMKGLRPPPPPAPSKKTKCNHLPNNMGFELYCDKCETYFNTPGK